MKRAIDLRSELAKLSDEQLAQRLRDAVSKYDKAQGRIDMAPEAIGAGAISGSLGGLLTSIVIVAGERWIQNSDPSVDKEVSAGEIRRLVREAKRRGFRPTPSRAEQVAAAARKKAETSTE